LYFAIRPLKTSFYILAPKTSKLITFSRNTFLSDSCDHMVVAVFKIL
jgi:hypothetical protein